MDRAGAILSQEFFSRDARKVARELLGARLVCNRHGEYRVGVITETEAYLGEEDKASHARFGPTARNAPMYGEAGYWYVYLCYGMHEMLNVVTGSAGDPQAVLIRGVLGHEGPGKLTKHLGIDRSFNAQPATIDAGLWIERGSGSIAPIRVRQAPRVGVAYAEEWAQKPWRYILETKHAK